LLAATAAHTAEIGDVDTDANGTVSMEELSAAMPDTTEDAFNAADADGDGELNADEFATLAQ
jgi:Ca2+-binding EF-hand superfamily protein